MRTNKYGVRGLKGVQLKRGFVYFWTPPISLQKRKIFHFTTLGTDFKTAVRKEQEWNSRLDAYRLAATEAACAGATPVELTSVGRWANQASIRRYLVQTLGQAAAVQAKRDAYRHLHREARFQSA
jgi:hypothetical protein